MRQTILTVNKGKRFDEEIEEREEKSRRKIVK